MKTLKEFTELKEAKDKIIVIPFFDGGDDGRGSDTPSFVVSVPDTGDYKADVQTARNIGKKKFSDIGTGFLQPGNPNFQKMDDLIKGAKAVAASAARNLKVLQTTKKKASKSAGFVGKI